jgi:hypothetical protein
MIHRDENDGRSHYSNRAEAAVRRPQSDQFLRRRDGPGNDADGTVGF